MKNRKHDAEFISQIEHQMQQRNRIRPARHRYADAIAWAKEAILADIMEHRLGQLAHGSMVQP
jgi:hypothetical protein